MLLASATDVIGSSGILGFVLGGGLLTAVIGGYRFFVNFRVTERGMARDRVAQAVSAEQAERRARQRVAREASLWQARCADLEYLLRKEGVIIPPLSSELYTLAYSNPPSESGANTEDSGDDKTHKRSRRYRDDDEDDDPLAALDSRLRREEQDERGGYRSLVRGKTAARDDEEKPDEDEDDDVKGRESS